MRRSQRPLRFVALVLAGWVGARVVVLLPGGAEALREVPGPVRVLLGTPAPAAAPRPVARRTEPRRQTMTAVPVASAPQPDDSPVHSTGRLIPADIATPARPSGPERSLAAGVGAAAAGGGAPSRWSGDAYLFLRSGGGLALGPGGQIGGGQAFARLSYRLDDAGRVAAVVRVSRAIGARQSEAALGLSVAPLPHRPLRLTVERRVGIDAGGRDAWAAVAAAGIDARRIGPLRLDGYAQAGIVGARRRDAFIDGAARLGHEAGRLTVGAGAWGAAQPGAVRLDVGPQAAFRLPVTTVGATLALDWRIRVAGRARPGSGVAVTLATGF